MANPYTLSPKQTRFCWHCARLDDPVEAALLAGYSAKSAGRVAFRLLAKQEIREEIERCRDDARKRRADLAAAGLLRLAAGGIGDAARLVCRETPPGEEELAAMDLAPVSELRRGKDGGLEVKLHDRLKALELLLTHSSAPEQEAGSFYAALDAAVSAMGGSPGGGGCEGRAL